jgi:glycosyltransferase involved in cell wall biosynthesis
MVSVVIPAFNAGRFIRRTIDSILAQTYKDYEIIVVDDGSTDDTAEVVKVYGAKVRYVYQENSGDGPARNAGIAVAKGDWISFLDHDDEWLPEKLQLQMELVSRHPELRWCGTNRYQSDGTRRAAVGNAEAIQKSLGGGDYFESYFKAVTKGVCPIITSTMLVHKEVFEQIGVFDSCWLRSADLDMWWRIGYRFPRIGYLPQPLVIVHLDAVNVVSAQYRSLSKRGEQARNLIAHHLELANGQGRLEEFKPYAGKLLRKVLITAIYRGFKTDARITVRQFSEFFPWHWRLGAYLLTVFPKLTLMCAQTIAYLRYRLGLERQVTRRWTYPKKNSKTY